MRREPEVKEMVESQIRDVQLDAMRGYVMMHIVCIVHLFYLYILPPAAFSLMLFEMPAMFFISGASVRLSHPKSFRLLLANRLRRVLWPYYVYALLSLLVIALSGIASLSDFGLQEYAQVLLARKIPSLPFAAHLWFVAPYLIISVSIHFQRRLAERWGIAYLLAISVLMAIDDAIYRLSDFSALEDITSIGQVVCVTLLYLLCYDLFFVAGFVCYRRLSTRTTVVVMVVSTALLVLLADGSMPDFQFEKFPPTTRFMLFGIASLCLLSLVIRHIRLPYPRIVAFWNKNSYSAYLYHNYGIWVFTALIAPGLFSCLPAWIATVTGIGILLLINTCLTALVVVCQTRVVSLVGRLRRKGKGEKAIGQ